MHSLVVYLSLFLVEKLTRFACPFLPPVAFRLASTPLTLVVAKHRLGHPILRNRRVCFGQHHTTTKRVRFAGWEQLSR